MKKLLLPFLALLLSASAKHPAPAGALSPLRANRDYALFFAVNDYAPGSGFDDLGKPIANAEAIATELRERYGFETEVVKNPTLDQISAKLREYQALFAKNPQGRYPSTGQLLIYFTGHGYAEDNNGYFVPADGNLKKLYSTAFAYEIWRPFIDRIDCRHILVAIDACYSVTFDPDWYNKKMDPGQFKRPGELSEGDKLLLANESDKCRIAFTSDGSEDKVPEQSNFARKFLDGLKNGVRQDGILTSEALSGFLRFASPKPRLSTFGNDENGSFLFAQKAGAAPTATSNPAETANLEKDLAAWRAAKATNTIAAYQDYLTRFPNGEFRDNAQTAIKGINADLTLRRDDLAWEVAVEKDTEEGYRKYLGDYPNGRHVAEAQSRMNSGVKNTGTVAFDDRMVKITGGTFMMGCTKEQQDCDGDEQPVHQVTVSDFYIGKYEVTQKQWIQVMGSNPSSNSNCDNCPVQNVNWEEVQGFIQKLNQQTGKSYRLPTEAEWEYAAREGGKSVLLGNGKNVADPAELNFDCRADYKRPYTIAKEELRGLMFVGSFKPNALGLYDMSGNVSEWCSDWYGSYPYGNQTNPKGPLTGEKRISRGGSWGGWPEELRVASRTRREPDYKHSTLGFRLARTL